MLIKLLLFFFPDSKIKNKKIINDIGRKIPKILEDVHNAAKNEKNNKLLQLVFSKALKQ